jgi:small conductance mechanosensitive channel
MDFFSVEYLEHLRDVYLVPFGINLLIAILVFYIGRTVARLIIRVLDRIATRSNVDESLRKFLLDLAYGLLMAIVVIAALERLGVKTTAAIAILGALGLAIGFALQGSLGNFASGVLIITFKPYKIGDLVEIAGHTGVVDDIKVFNTVLRSPDNIQILVPNGQVTGGTIKNMSTRGIRRVDMVFGIGYDDDIKKAKEMIEKVLSEDSRILAEPTYQVAVSNLGDSSVDLVVRPWVKVEDYWGVKFHTLERLKLEADAAGISIPFPQRDVHLFEEKKAA